MPVAHCFSAKCCYSACILAGDYTSAVPGPRGPCHAASVGGQLLGHRAQLEGQASGFFDYSVRFCVCMYARYLLSLSFAR